MHDLIRRVAEWLSLLLGPGPGTHRRTARHACPRRHRRPYVNPAGTVAPALTRAHLAAVPSPAQRPAHLPYHRSPYGRAASAPIDATAPTPVRPYVVAHERERARQRRRRAALVLAADFGVDLDRHLVGADDGLLGRKVAV